MGDCEGLFWEACGSESGSGQVGACLLQIFDRFLFWGLVEKTQVDIVVGGVSIVIDRFVITGEDVTTN